MATACSSSDGLWPCAGKTISAARQTTLKRRLAMKTIFWCLASEACIPLQRTLLQEPEAKGHQQFDNSGVVLDLTLLPAAILRGTSNPPYQTKPVCAASIPKSAPIDHCSKT